MKRDEFKVLDEREHILQRAGMYIGSTSLEPVSGIFNGEYKTLNIVPGLIKIINEILDNSVDEFIRTDGNFSNVIRVSITNNVISGSLVSIEDNGRGIPQDKIDGKYRPVLAWSQARAGSNFSDDENRVTMGMNGVGSFATNVFSNTFKGITSNGTHTLMVSCKNNGIVKDVSQTKCKNGQGTLVQFSPDLDKLGGLDCITEDHIEFMEDRCRNLAASFPGLEITFNKKKYVFKTQRSFIKQFDRNSVSVSDKNATLVISNSGSDHEFRLLSYVNGLNVRNGGSHVDYVVSSIIDELRPMIKRKHKIEVLPNQIKQHLQLVLFMRGVKNLKFDSQTKERITNSRAEIANSLQLPYAKIAKGILDTPELIDPIIQTILAKKDAAERAALSRQQKKLKKVRVAKHIEASSKSPADKILFLLEGDSAIGSLIRVRNPKRHGGFPLRGKVRNTRGMTPKQIVENKELSELMAITNLQFGKEKQDLTYGKIGILTDADTDGQHILCLLVNFFSNWESLFKEGRIYKVESPLIVATKGNQKKIFYSMEEYNKSRIGSGWTIDYKKGLGSLDVDEYREVINNPRLTKITLNGIKDIDALDVAFGDDADARKKWLAQ